MDAEGGGFTVLPVKDVEPHGLRKKERKVGKKSIRFQLTLAFGLFLFILFALCVFSRIKDDSLTSSTPNLASTRKPYISLLCRFFLPTTSITTSTTETISTNATSSPTPNPKPIYDDYYYSGFNLRRGRQYRVWRHYTTLYPLIYDDTATTINTSISSTPTPPSNWTTIIHYKDQGENYARNWSEYKNGWGSMGGNFYAGNEEIHRLTSESKKALQIKMTIGGEVITSCYSSFKVKAEADGYQLQVSDFMGETQYNWLDCMNSPKLRTLNNTKFSTIDKDNDNNGDVSVANYYKSAWWFSNGYFIHPTSRYGGVGKVVSCTGKLYRTQLVTELLFRINNVNCFQT